MILSFIVGLAWLGPAVYLIYLNVSGHIVGASAWCPGGSCSIISYYQIENSTTSVRAALADRDNHDLIGGLQLAAKAMEIWFMAVAGSLVFTVSRILAQRPGGLPLGYLLTHLEIGDPRLLLNFHLFTAPNSKRLKLQGEKKRHTLHLYAFGLLSIIMCIIATLMGPSVAVMMIPTLNWERTDRVGVGYFDSMLASKAPSYGTNDKIPGCTAADLEDAHYNCTFSPYADTMDALIENSVAFVSHNSSLAVADNVIYAPSIEGIFPFTFNYTIDPKTSQLSTLWAPNRQVIRALTHDFERLSGVVLGTSEDPQYINVNSSVGLQLEREGPILGTSYYYGVGFKTTTVIDDKRWIDCLLGFIAEDKVGGDMYTKCYRRGTGWNSTYTEAAFSIGATNTSAINTMMQVTSLFYWSDANAYWKGTIDDTPTCFKNGTLTADEEKGCDWDKLFSQPPPAGFDLEDVPRAGLITEWSSPLLTNQSLTVVTEMYPSVGIATYSVDVTEVYPMLKEVQIPILPKEEDLTPVVLHADWVLAAWSGMNSDDFPDRRPSAIEARMSVNDMVQTFQSLSNDETVDMTAFNSTIERSAMVVIMSSLETLSMVTFDTTTDAPSSDDAAQRAHPRLTTRVRYQVWSFGLNSRTSHMGLAILIAGCITVLIRSALLLYVRSRNPSTVDLVVNALEHPPNGEFSNAQGESERAKVRFKINQGFGGVEKRISFQRQ